MATFLIFMQESAVNEEIALFSGEKDENQAREIWLVDKAPVVIEKLGTAVKKLEQFMLSQVLEAKTEEVINLKGDKARGQFINLFKEVQRLKTVLNQYNDLTEDNKNLDEEV